MLVIFEPFEFINLDVFELLRTLELELLRMLEPTMLLPNLELPPINWDDSLEADIIYEVLLGYPLILENWWPP